MATDAWLPSNLILEGLATRFNNYRRVATDAWLPNSLIFEGRLPIHGVVEERASNFDKDK
ncbi:hypothetical protein [Scytonema sp. PCC 10023]|uniref:hypothetical protein n=1 Tax=Scytonema sp. PCC 10023 TaxID=1680591 RepID=UPI0039C6931A